MKSSELSHANNSASVNPNSVISNDASQPGRMKRIILACMVGNALEWYDFVIYGYFAKILGGLFFPATDARASILLPLGVFAVGFLARPVGSIIFGHIGDQVSRKKALLASIYVMAIPTVLIGCLPTYEQIGLLAPAALVVLRIMQGIAIGGEFTGSMVFMVESSEPHRRGLSGSWATCSLVLGVIVGSSVATAFTHFLTEQQLLQWGWRIPFIVSIFGSIIGARLRQKLIDPESFSQAKRERKSKTAPLKELVANHMPKILLVILIDFLTAIGFFLIVIFFSVFFQTDLKMPASVALLINTVNMIIFAAVIPVGGWLSDLFGRKRVMLVPAICFALCSYPLFKLFTPHSYALNFMVQMTFVIMMGLFFGTIPATLAELFPGYIRFSGLSLGHNLSMAIFGGSAPWCASLLISLTGNIYSPAFMLMGAAVLTLSALPLFKDKYKQRELD